MKKLTFCFLATSFVLFAIPTQLQAGTEENPTTLHSTESTINSNRSDEIKSIGLTAITTTESKETLKEAIPEANNLNRHSRGYLRRHGGENDQVVITSGTQVRDDGYLEGRHRNGGTYIGVGGVLVLILILILVL
jgi:hypothetical protein